MISVNLTGMNLTGLVLVSMGFIYTFWLPGFLLIETFYTGLAQYKKIPLILLTSVLISTYWVYVVSLGLGLTRGGIMVSAVAFVPWLVWLRRKRGVRGGGQGDKAAIMLAVGTAAVIFLALWPGIMTEYKGNYILSAVNWQDGAMHIGIIESLAEGNFPPQAPYFSGQGLSYYYFSDLHSAILRVLWGEYFPRIVVWVNPLLSMTFVLAMYALAKRVTENKRAALIAAFLAMFSGNMMFVRAIGDMARLNWGAGVAREIRNLLATKGYSLEYGGLMQMVPMVDYFLQNRPAMVGLPGVVTVMLLVLEKKERRKAFGLAGLITGLLIKFQLFAAVVGVACLLVGWGCSLERKRIREELTTLMLALVPVAGLMTTAILMRVGERTVTGVVSETMAWGVWEKGKSISWFGKFYLTNFGLPFVVAIAYWWVRMMRKKRGRRAWVFLGVMTAFLWAVPHLVRVTIFSGDMLKFFYFMMIPVAVAAGEAMARGLKMKGGGVLVAVVLMVSSLTAGLILCWSALNKNVAYSKAEWEAGGWIRENTAQKAVFLGLPTVHTPITQIGGRLRVLSYITWPYSHGFNSGEDNVFSRLAEIERFYKKADEGAVRAVVGKYGVDYIYWGREEESKYPGEWRRLERNGLVKLVYAAGGVRIYRVRS